MDFKHQKNKILIIGAIAILVVLAFVFSRGNNPFSKEANKEGQEKKTTSAEVISDFLNSSDPELKEIAKRAQATSSPESSIYKIEREFREGKLDVNEYLKLKVLAIFAPKKLPAEFKSEVFKELQGDMLLKEIREYQSQLDSETKDLLSPFIILPEKEGSYFNPHTNREEVLDKISQSL